ncbi:MAG: hypothetical protein AAB645_00025 [Patescibacteria group bacterium]|mgnify:CR=1 FL=1
MKEKISEGLGWYGMIAIVLAYCLNSFGLILSSSFTYQILNLTGAIGIVVVSLLKKAYQPAVLNIIWSVIAFIAIISLFR